MQPNQWEIMILKPSPVFLSFIHSQLPEITLPEFRLLQTDNTGYIFHKQDSEEAILDEIERQYLKIFQYEIRRWLGGQVRQDIRVSFLDFLCCFKFDIYPHILLMESSVIDAKQMVSIRPRNVLRKFLHEQLKNYPDFSGEVLTHINTSEWLENATVVVKNLGQISDLKPFLKLFYQEIYEAEQLRIDPGEVMWPNIDSYQMFCRYFVAELHTQLVYLS